MTPWRLREEVSGVRTVISAFWPLYSKVISMHIENRCLTQKSTTVPTVFCSFCCASVTWICRKIFASSAAKPLCLKLSLLQQSCCSQEGSTEQSQAAERKDSEGCIPVAFVQEREQEVGPGCGSTAAWPLAGCLALLCLGCELLEEGLYFLWDGNSQRPWSQIWFHSVILIEIIAINKRISRMNSGLSLFLL